MKKLRLFILLLVIATFCWFLSLKIAKTFTFIPFEVGQISEELTPKEQLFFYDRLKKKKWRKLHRLYKLHLSGKRKRHNREKIPKLIHQIWLGGPLPQEYQNLHLSWVQQHPGWEYHLWTEEEIKYLYLQNYPLFEIATLEKKEELLKYEILYQFGGLFVDIHFECLKPFDILHETCDLFAGVDPQIRSPVICDCLIGSTPGHPLIKRCIKELKTHPASKTDSLFFTRCFFETIKKNHAQPNVVLPSMYFYPTQQNASHSFAIFHPELTPLSDAPILLLEP